MFSSGFFLLPGIAFAEAGAWIVFAYLASAVIVLPAMFSKAELASSLTKSGGTYYFLDRSMGPLVGTVGGIGTWVAMGLKNTFALVGCGAYAALFFDVDITLVALLAAVGFVILNVFGAKETAALQRWLVYTLLAVLGVFAVSGVVHLGGEGVVERTRETFGAAPSGGFDSIATTIALVFVSYAGLTKVVGVAEEIDRPDRNLLRGMGLSLLTAATLYGVGTYLVVMVVDHGTLGMDLTPIASAAEHVLDWMPGRVGVAIIFVAAVAAFASTANAGIMSASRYLLAMGRDRLISERFAHIGRFQTPTLGVLATGAFIVIALLTLDVVSIAKLASAFQLLMFAFVCLAVIVMRESQIESYHPTVKSPFYPWLHIVGVFLPLLLILELGVLSILFTFGLVVGGVAWYFGYAKSRVDRRGAILHWFERLGRDRSDTLAHEIWSIMKDSGLSDSDPYLQLIGRARFIDLDGKESFESLAKEVAGLLAEKTGLSADDIEGRFRQGVEAGLVPVTQDLALPHFRAPTDRHEMVVVRSLKGVDVKVMGSAEGENEILTVSTLFFLISPERDPGEHLRILARLASHVDHDDFTERWAAQEGPEDLRRMLMGETMADVAQELSVRDAGGPVGLVAMGTTGDFERLLCVANPGSSHDELLESAARVAGVHDGCRLTVVKTLPQLRGLTDDLAEAVQTDLTTRFVEPLRQRGIDSSGKVLVGKPWTTVIKEAVSGRHDLVLLSTENDRGGGFDSFTRHILRKCPKPVWVERPAHFKGYRKILAAVDTGHDEGAYPSLNLQVLEVARRIAERTDAELHVVQAWFLPGEELLHTRGVSSGELDFLRRRERQRVQAAFSDIMGALGIEDAHLHLVEGEPADVITRVADEEQADLVVMGTVGRIGLVGRFIGGTAEDVLRRLECGVVALKPEGFESPIKP